MLSSPDDFGKINVQGTIMELLRESRWNRMYATADRKKRLKRSRFADGSATITTKQLAEEWITWKEDEKKDFCDAIKWLPNDKKTEVLRFLLQNADFRLLHNNALTIARYLPTLESLPWLITSIEHLPVGKAIAYIQALAYTKAPEAIPLIRRRFLSANDHPEILQNDAFMNWIAAEAIHSARYLVALGCSPLEFKERLAKLAAHPCLGIRQMYATYFAKFFAPNHAKE